MEPEQLLPQKNNGHGCAEQRHQVDELTGDAGTDHLYTLVPAQVSADGGEQRDITDGHQIIGVDRHGGFVKQVQPIDRSQYQVPRDHREQQKRRC